MRPAWLLALIAVVVACGVDTGAGPQPKKIEPAYIDEHLLKAVPPELTTRLDVALGSGAVVYLGNTVDHEMLAPGGVVKVTHYWKVAREIGPGWRVFARMRGQPGSADFMNLPATDMELGHSPESWRPGEIIADPQDFILRPDWRSPGATLEVGLIRVGEHGTEDRMLADGPHVVDRAIVAREFQVDLSRAPPPPGTVYIPRATGPITIDGVANEASWQTAAVSPEFATAEGSPEPIGKATAKMTWDDTSLYVFVSVVDTDIVSEFKKHDDSLWKADDVEVFIDADNNRKGYVELQVNPNNATFDSWFATTRAQPGDPTWDSGMRTEVKLRGTTEPNDTDQGWDAEIAIPWDAVKGRDAGMKVRLPPQVGDRWRLNVVRVDSRSGDKSQGASSWNRITYGDFHALDRMLTAVFADSTGAIVVKQQPVVPVVPAGSGSGSGAGSGGGSGDGSASSGRTGSAGSAVLPSTR
nr:carbohydrate-binding family 9-like protein [Kofleriaceae bacterium]